MKIILRLSIRRASSYSLAAASNGSSRLPPVRGRYVPPGRRAGLPAGDSAPNASGYRIDSSRRRLLRRLRTACAREGGKPRTTPVPLDRRSAPVPIPASVPRWLATAGRNPSRSPGSFPGFPGAGYR